MASELNNRRTFKQPESNGYSRQTHCALCAGNIRRTGRNA